VVKSRQRFLKKDKNKCPKKNLWKRNLQKVDENMVS